MARDHVERGESLVRPRPVEKGVVDPADVPGQDALDEARANGTTLPVAALVDQFYAEVQAMGGNRWDTSSLAARLQPKD